MYDGLCLNSTEGMGICVRQKKFFGKSIGRLECAVCPRCGYTETYISDTEKLNDIIEKDMEN